MRSNHTPHVPCHQTTHVLILFNSLYLNVAYIFNTQGTSLCPCPTGNLIRLASNSQMGFNIEHDSKLISTGMSHNECTKFEFAGTSTLVGSCEKWRDWEAVGICKEWAKFKQGWRGPSEMFPTSLKLTSIISFIQNISHRPDIWPINTGHTCPLQCWL